MRTARIDIRTSEALKERIVRHREATGVPITVFVERAVVAALDAAEPASSRKPSRRTKPSAN